jgi:hypothetical protein
MPLPTLCSPTNLTNLTPENVCSAGGHGIDSKSLLHLSLDRGGITAVLTACMVAVRNGVCLYRTRRNVLGCQIELSSDSLPLHNAVAGEFVSKHFLPRDHQPSISFSCILGVRSPWQFAVVAGDDVVYLGALSKSEPSALDVLRFDGDSLRSGSSLFSAGVEQDLTPDLRFGLIVGYFEQVIFRELVLRRPARRLVHASSVGHHSRGALILGPSHSGKSTLALACAATGMRLFGDDQALVDLETGELLPFPLAIRIRQEACRRFPDVADLCARGHADELDDGRYHINPDLMGYGANGSRAQLTHVIRLCGFGSRPTLTRSTQREFVGICVQSDTVEIGPGALDLMWKWGSVLNDVSCYDLVVGHPMETATLLRNLLERGSDAR